MMLGSLLLIPVYLMMAYTQVTLYVPMAMMGIAFSLIPGRDVAVGGVHR